jgi:Mu-like prophage major head subunit gpT
MSVPMNTGLWGKLLWPGVNKWYGDSYNDYKTEYTEIFDTEKSDRAYEEDVSVSGFGLAQIKGEGQSVSYDTEQQGFLDRYTHATYSLGFVITKELVEDDLYSKAGKRKAQGLARSMRQTKEIVAANILNRAFNTSYLYGDGKALIVSDHPNIAGGTWSNLLAVAADLSEASLESAWIQIAKYTDDRGLRIAVKPKKLIVPVDEALNAMKIMGTEYEVGTNNNTINVVKSKYPGGVVVNHYLTDTDAWFIATDVPNGLKHFERVADSFSMDDDFETDNAKFKARARYSFGCSDKRAIFGTPGA